MPAPACLLVVAEGRVVDNLVTAASHTFYNFTNCEQLDNYGFYGKNMVFIQLLRAKRVLVEHTLVARLSGRDIGV